MSYKHKWFAELAIWGLELQGQQSTSSGQNDTPL
jgi:hypothetical protein